MSIALASWKVRVKKFILAGKTFEEAKKSKPTLRCIPDDVVSKRRSAWGKDLQSKKLGVQNLSCGGYRGKDKIWVPHTRAVIRSKYHYDPITKKLTTDQKVKRFEEILAAKEKVYVSQISSSQGLTMIGSRWDTALNRAVNVMKGWPKIKPSMSAGRVLGEGLSVKWLDKYDRQQKEKKALSEDGTHELHELRERVEKIPEIVDKRVVDKVDSLVIEKITAMMPSLFEAFGTWDASGRVGVPLIPSIIGSNLSATAPNVLVTPAANTAAVPHIVPTPITDTMVPVANTAA
jgi:hypothetical protein